jgi:hypothetical protein
MQTRFKLRFIGLSILTLLVSSSQCSSEKSFSGNTDVNLEGGVAIPTAGNSWFINQPFKNHQYITDNGIEHWSGHGDTIRTYFRVVSANSLSLGIRARARGEASSVAVEVCGQATEIKVTSAEFTDLPVGEFKLNDAGYQEVDIISSPGNQNAELDISHIIVTGDFKELDYVKDDFYWGRRGPSVHLRYNIPKEASPIRYFYNEITVPEGEDVQGSYFMANGFGQGYMGIQVNSEVERRILFSVWSPFHTDNPDEIPEHMRIKLLKKGDDVHAGKFGNEGSGGQSYKKFMWKAGVTYGFLLKGEPTESNSTRFTAWFFDSELNQWSLIASFERPETNTYLTGLHSFLENFRTETGFISRKAYYSNQWVFDIGENWHRLTGAVFTADATARKKARLDYAGGAEGGKFFMKNCGFFNSGVEIDSEFFREPVGKRPQINFEELP